MTFSCSPLANLKYPDVLECIGEPNTTYTITLPEDTSPRGSVPHSWESRDLLVLPVYFRNVKCIIDEDKIRSRFPQSASEIHSFFMVNDNVFIANANDKPIRWDWIKYSEFTTAFFIFCHRFSTTFIFKDTVPAYPLPGKSAAHFSLVQLEHNAHSRSLQSEKDIPVFFSGRHSCRVARKHSGNTIKRHFPDAYIHFLETRTSLSKDEYMDTIIRAKIAWCPRSVWSPPDPECNSSIPKEFEAMGLELLLVKHPIGVIETEERIPGVHFVEIKNDSSDLIEKLQYYLEHEDERKEIAHNGRLWWERNCSTVARANFIMNSCLRSMGHPFKDLPCYERMKF